MIGDRYIRRLEKGVCYYGPWEIQYAPESFIRACDAYMWTHKDYDGDEDNRHGRGSSVQDCLGTIHDYEDGEES